MTVPPCADLRGRLQGRMSASGHRAPLSHLPCRTTARGGFGPRFTALGDKSITPVGILPQQTEKLKGTQP